MSVLEAALGLLREGFHPVILYPVGFVAWPGAEPKSGKEAIVRQWGQRPPFPEEIEELLDQYPGAGLGLCLGPGKGPGGRWLIDVEGDGPAAEESVAVLCDGEVVATRSWGSARGRHRLFYVDADRLRAIVANQGTVLKDPPGLPDLELRFGGAGKQLQSAYPPTLTTLYGPDGTPLPGPPRRWLETGPITALPEAAYAVLERLLPRSGHRAPDRPRPHATGVLERPDGPGTTPYGAAALQSECDTVACTLQGKRHEALREATMRVASLVHGGEVNVAAYREDLMVAARTCGLPDAEAQELIESALDKAEPRTVEPARSARVAWSNLNSPGHEEDGAHIRAPDAGAHSRDPDSGAHRRGEEEYPNTESNLCAPLLGSPPLCAPSHGPPLCAPPLDPAILAAVQESVPVDGKSWGEGLYRLIRRLRSIRPDAPLAELRPIVKQWVVACWRRGVAVTGVDDAWATFRRKWSTLPCDAVGNELSRVLARTSAVAVPPALAGTRWEPLARVLIALHEVAASRGDAVFYAPERTIAKGADLGQSTARRQLKQLKQLGYLSRVKAGGTGTAPGTPASEWCWHDPPRPGEAEWADSPPPRPRLRPDATGDDEGDDAFGSARESDHGPSIPTTSPRRGET